MSKSSVEVTAATREMLKTKKAQLGLRSVDAVIQHLCANFRDEVEERSSSSSEGEASDEPARRRHINVREPLYSLEILGERDGMVEYYTGFDRPTVNLLIRRIQEVSTTCHTCCSPRARCRTRVSFRVVNPLLIGG